MLIQDFKGAQEAVGGILGKGALVKIAKKPVIRRSKKQVTKFNEKICLFKIRYFIDNPIIRVSTLLIRYPIIAEARNII